MPERGFFGRRTNLKSPEIDDSLIPGESHEQLTISDGDSFYCSMDNLFRLSIEQNSR